jgi:hypothetical protein
MTTGNLPFQVGKFYKIKRMNSGYIRTTLCLCLKIAKIKRSYDPWEKFIFLTLDNQKKILSCYDWYFDLKQGLEWSYEEFNSF